MNMRSHWNPRNYLRFRLWHGAVMLTAFCVVLGRLSQQWHDQQSAVVAIRSHGVWVDYKHSETSRLERLIESMVGENFLRPPLVIAADREHLIAAFPDILRLRSLQAVHVVGKIAPLSVLIALSRGEPIDYCALAERLDVDLRALRTRFPECEIDVGLKFPKEPWWE